MDKSYGFILGIIVCAFLTGPRTARASCIDDYNKEESRIEADYRASCDEVRSNRLRYDYGWHSGRRPSDLLLDSFDDDRRKSHAINFATYSACMKREREAQAAAEKAKRDAEEAAEKAKRDAWQAAENARREAQNDKQAANHAKHVQAMKDAASAAPPADVPKPTDFSTEFYNGVKAKAASEVRPAIEKVTGASTHVPGEAVANHVKEYIESAEDRASQINPLAARTVKGINQIGDRVMDELNRPGHAPAGGDSSGYSPASGGSSGYSPGAPAVGPSSFAAESAAYANSPAARAAGSPPTQSQIANDLFGASTSPRPAASSPAPSGAPTGGLASTPGNIAKDLFGPTPPSGPAPSGSKPAGAANSSPAPTIAPAPATQPAAERCIQNGSSIKQIQDELFGPGQGK